MFLMKDSHRHLLGAFFYLALCSACSAKRSDDANNADMVLTQRSNMEVRMSYTECDVEGEEKHDCGYNGMTEEECHRRGCCYATSASADVPSCFYSKDMVTEACESDVSSRQECGFPGIRKEQCLFQGCCYQPRNEHNVPWCYTHRVSLDDPAECGLTPIPPNVHGRIVNGEDARPHSWPWQVSLDHVEYGHMCGASLISNQWVLTASHCIYTDYFSFTEDDYMVRLGMHNASGPHDDMFLEVPIEKIITHPDYDFSVIMNDVALLKLAYPVRFSDGVRPVCLADVDEDFPGGTRCYGTGWGKIDWYTGELANELQQVKLPIVPHDACAEFYSDFAEFGYSVDEGAMICAGYEEGGKNPCSGDSGGPLVVYRDQRWSLIGVTSWSRKPCASEYGPEVYARVSQFREWIDMTVSTG